MANKRDKVSFLVGIVRGDGIQPVWRDRDCATVCGVGSRIQWATSTAWTQDGSNASNFSRQAVPFSSSPVASAAVHFPRDRGNGS